jgi:hypothetical protein
MFNIREKCTYWSAKTFKEELDSLNISNKLLYDTTLNCFNSLEISNKKINGYSCEKLPKTQEGHTGVKVTYSELFHRAVAEDNFSPVSYLVKLVEEFLNTNGKTDKLLGAMARGLRTFASLLREPDFAYQVEQYLKKYDVNVKTDLNSKQDGGDHTDVLLYFKGNQYRLWLFQFSPRGLPHDIERISGKRGELPPGIHILCPLHTEVALDYDKNRKKADKLLEKINRDKALLLNCSAKAVKKRSQLEQKIQENSSLFQNTIVARDAAYLVSSKELDILEGWFLYSDEHIKRIGNFIINKPSIDTYENVKEILTGPEKYLSEVRIFNK